MEVVISSGARLFRAHSLQSGFAIDMICVDHPMAHPLKLCGTARRGIIHQPEACEMEPSAEDTNLKIP